MNNPPKILAVDDDPRVLLGTVRILKGANYEVIEAHNGRECLDAVRLHNPDLVLLDVVMPDMDGTEVCRIIKGDPKRRRTFVVLTSGNQTSPDDQAEGLDYGADGYINRPFSIREFLSRIASILRIKKAEDDLLDEKEKVERLNAELMETLGRIKTLEGILSICMFCHKIRTDGDMWEKLEIYLLEHTDAMVSHGMCPECAKLHYPGISEGGEEDAGEK